MLFRQIALSCFLISLLSPICLWGQLSSPAPVSSRFAAPSPSVTQDSLIIIRVDFAGGLGLEKGAGNQTVRIIAPEVQIVLAQFNILEEDIIPLSPGFNEADTLLSHADGYTYRAPNYANSVRIKMYIPSRKAELIQILSETRPIIGVMELPKLKALD